MFILVQLVAAVTLGVLVYRWVARHNAALVEREGDEVMLRTLDQGTAAVMTAFVPIFGLPYVAYRIHGPIGVLYGLGLWVGYFVFTVALLVGVGVAASAWGG